MMEMMTCFRIFSEYVAIHDKVKFGLLACVIVVVSQQEQIEL